MDSFHIGIRDAMTKAASVMKETAQNVRSQIRATKRSTVKAVEHKPMVIKTPKPKPPQVEPSTFTPTQKTAKGESTWQGQKIREWRKGPENEPLSESWRGRDF